MATIPRRSRKLDLVVWGATGFTGILVAKYLARTQGTKIKWAIAGRNAEKLAEVKKQIVAANPATESVEILIGDASDQKSVDAIVGNTRVIVSMAGPFLNFGEPVVAACARLGTDYVDSTGEHWWVREMIDKYSAEARRNGAVIVPQCGFDSIPADIGAFFLADNMQNELKQKCRSVSSVVSTVGGASGGTWASILNIVNVPLKSLKELKNPFYLSPGRTRIPPKDGSEVEVAVKDPIRPADRTQQFIRYDEETKGWTIPFIMAATNESTVRRSNALRQRVDGVGYGEEFSYRESMRVPNLLIGILLMIAFAFLTVLLTVARFIRPIHSLLSRLVPQPGQGPPESARAKAYFKYQLSGVTTDQRTVRAVLMGGDPYDETAVMLAESALCLVQQRDSLPHRDGGFVTASFAFGNMLVKRLQNSDSITLKLVSDFSAATVGPPRKDKTK